MRIILHRVWTNEFLPNLHNSEYNIIKELINNYQRKAQNSMHWSNFQGKKTKTF